jgi:hypothetical protein
MKRVQRWRYYCDFCKKSGNSGGHMKSHEASCTLNPARVCKLCLKNSDGAQADMAAMLAILPDPAQFMVTLPAEYVMGDTTDEWLCIRQESTHISDEAIKPALALAMPKLRELANECPVCILAALRQKGIPVPIVDGFNFKEELAEFWSGFNDAQEERERYYL